MTSVPTHSSLSWARPVGIAALTLVLPVIAVVLEEVHFQSVASWITGVPLALKGSAFGFDECRFWLDLLGCRSVRTDDILLPILAISGMTLMAYIAIRRRYRRRYSEN